MRKECECRTNGAKKEIRNVIDTTILVKEAKSQLIKAKEIIKGLYKDKLTDKILNRFIDKSNMDSADIYDFFKLLALKKQIST